MDGIFERAARWGVETDYRDGFGNLRTVAPEVLARILEALAAGGDGSERILPRTIVLRSGAEQALHLAGSERERLRWEIVSEGKIAAGEATCAQLTLPALEDGVFRLRVTIPRPEGDRSESACLIVCRDRAYQGGQTAPARMWALAVQLYGVRSRRNWGHGDFTDLVALVDLAADLGAAGVGLNPLHALFDDRPADSSPYAPNSRLFFNPLYIDVEAVPEFPGLQAAGLEDEVARLRRQDVVDYEGVAKTKLRALELAYQVFLRQGTAERHRAFDRFRETRGSTLVRFACFEWLRRRYGHPWWEWPSDWRRAEDEKLMALRQTEAELIGLFEFVQWLAHDQLDRCRAKAQIEDPNVVGSFVGYTPINTSDCIRHRA